MTVAAVKMWGVWIEYRVGGRCAGGAWGAHSFVVFATPSKGHAIAQAAEWERNARALDPSTEDRYAAMEFDE